MRGRSIHLFNAANSVIPEAAKRLFGTHRAVCAVGPGSRAEALARDGKLVEEAWVNAKKQTRQRPDEFSKVQQRESMAGFADRFHAMQYGSHHATGAAYLV